MSYGNGSIVERKRKRGVYFGIRFMAGGRHRYQSLGADFEGWTRRKAEAELANVIADVRRGRWVDPATLQPPRKVPTFHEFASEWLADQEAAGGRRGKGLTPSGRADLAWRLEVHLLPTFAPLRLDEITVEDVDRFRMSKVRKGKLSVTSINKLLSTLAAILEVARERELIDRNPAAGKRRRLPSVTPARSWLDRADHITALLDGARRLDEAAYSRPGQRRALLATLVFAGLRIGEALALTWRDVDLARGTILVRAAKTEAGKRSVNILPCLRDELLEYRARQNDSIIRSEALVFANSEGRNIGATNVRLRILAPAVEAANVLLAKQGSEPLPEGLTPHSLRRTFASVLFAVGEPHPYVIGQMGHTDPAMTLGIYARAWDRRDGEPERLRALVNGEPWTMPQPPRVEAGLR